MEMQAIEWSPCPVLEAGGLEVALVYREGAGRRLARCHGL